MRKIFFVLAVGILFSACQGEISGLTENYENVTVLKENKLFEVKIGDKTFKLDLIQQRDKK